jgi:hypothetical protein
MAAEASFVLEIGRSNNHLFRRIDQPVSSSNYQNLITSMCPPSRHEPLAGSIRQRIGACFSIFDGTNVRTTE